MKRLATDQDVEDIRGLLRKLDMTLEQSANQLASLRKAIMERVDRFNLNDLLLQLPESDRRKVCAEMSQRGDASFSDEWTAVLGGYNDFLCAVMRAYAQLRFDDVGEGDWFTFYYEASKARTRVMLSMITKHLSGEGGGVEAMIYKMYESVMEGVRRRAIEAEPREVFPRTDGSREPPE
jgi:hypothetical protein